jgi:hypothetical protein
MVRDKFFFCEIETIHSTVKFANSPLYACHGSSGQKPQYGFMTLAYQCFTAVLLIYGRLFLSGVYYCLSVLVCHRENVGA